MRAGARGRGRQADAGVRGEELGEADDPEDDQGHEDEAAECRGGHF